MLITKLIHDLARPSNLMHAGSLESKKVCASAARSFLSPLQTFQVHHDYVVRFPEDYHMKTARVLVGNLLKNPSEAPRSCFVSLA